jgi:putative endonuclease
MSKIKLKSRAPKSATRAPAPRASARTRVQNQEPQDCYCYIVECSDGTFYTGWTTNLENRVATHNAGRGSRYTRLRRPVRLVYFEHLPNRSEAMRRETQIKRMSRPAKLKKISNFKCSQVVNV